jgi:NADPH2:quinone reductase
MRAVRVHRTGGPEVLRLDEVDAPRPGPGEALIRVAVAGVNMADVGMRAGFFHGAGRLPATPGFEAGGDVEAVGDGVDGSWVGRRVVAELLGGYAEYAVAPADALIAVPDGLALEDAIAVPIQGLTALGALRDGGRLADGDTVLITGAAGGVGSQAVQIARALGAGRVVALAGAAEKRALALDLGADAAVDYRAEDWEDQVRAVAGGRERPGPVPGGNPMQAAPGVADLALDGVAGPVTAGLLRLAVPRTGRIVTVGGASGAPPELDVFELNRRNLTVTGFSLPTWAQLPGWRAQAAGLLLGWLRDGRVRVVRGPSFPLDRAADAHRALEDRSATGKLLLRVT